ncbi:hypothetical protein MPTK1_5g00490 [Marchantia polymorpha subsp. ruderalis]|uniref:Uncharacterized protein n=2 Tax=Marchantia polymorpha TaxID=3197 RepID=A0AAF6BDG9_MARPO|nr:hypothetical protein MARPO_0078s0048 [Marchantia polymorpha]BBN10053.1 hypothetical protein Mp_5g00490 [Marchantia polymorpha subsp. ruderalis]|eukprot:PTQ34646.1 hypothetical protein MARPO_0078s0048 [Marchantia polymorpha]
MPGWNSLGLLQQFPIKHVNSTYTSIVIECWVLYMEVTPLTHKSKIIVLDYRRLGPWKYPLWCSFPWTCVQKLLSFDSYCELAFVQVLTIYLFKLLLYIYIYRGEVQNVKTIT